jgi:hypothetical protein
MTLRKTLDEIFRSGRKEVLYPFSCEQDCISPPIFSTSSRNCTTPQRQIKEKKKEQGKKYSSKLSVLLN